MDEKLCSTCSSCELEGEMPKWQKYSLEKLDYIKWKKNFLKHGLDSFRLKRKNFFYNSTKAAGFLFIFLFTLWFVKSPYADEPKYALLPLLVAFGSMFIMMLLGNDYEEIKWRALDYFNLLTYNESENIKPLVFCYEERIAFVMPTSMKLPINYLVYSFKKGNITKITKAVYQDMLVVEGDIFLYDVHVVRGEEMTNSIKNLKSEIYKNQKFFIPLCFKNNEEVLKHISENICEIEITDKIELDV